MDMAINAAIKIVQGIVTLYAGPVNSFAKRPHEIILIIGSKIITIQSFIGMRK